MRHIIDDFISTHDNTLLLIADLGYFPKSEACGRCINVGVSETLLVNTAIGLALTGIHVYIYSVANFVLYRAFELILLHVVGKSSRNKDINITFLNGGSGFCYAGCGIGHYLLDDILLMSTYFTTIQSYFPYDGDSTYKALTLSNIGINYIRLCLDSQSMKLTLLNIIDTQKLNVVTFGWLVEKVQKICYTSNINVNIIPIFTLSLLDEINELHIIIYDNIYIRNFSTATSLGEYYFSTKLDCIGLDNENVLVLYKFDDDHLINFIKKYV